MRRRVDPKLVGLKIGDEAVRLAIAAEGVVQCRSGVLPAGAVRNGEVVDSGAVVEVVRRLLAACGARPRYAALVCAGRRTVCRAEALRSGEVAAAKAACADRMRRYLIFGSQPTTVSHCVQRGTALEGGDTWLLSAAAPVAQVEGHADVARRCGLTVLRVEPSTAALARVLRSGDEAVPPTLVVNAHCGACEIAAVRDDGLIYCQHLPLDIEALASDGDALCHSFEQLVDFHYRHACGRQPIEQVLWCGDPRLEPVRARAAGQGFSGEWIDPARFPGVRRLEGDGLDDPAVRAAMAPAVAAALHEPDGLGQRGELNLLPPAPRKRHPWLASPWLIVPAVLTLLLTSGLVGWDAMVRRRAARLAELVNHPTAEMLECSRLLRRESELKERLADATALLAAVPRGAGAEFLAELPRRLTDELWLGRVELGGEGVCSIEGVARSEQAVFAFTDLLRVSPQVTAVRMGEMGSERDRGLILTRFQLEATLASAEGTASIGEKR